MLPVFFINKGRESPFSPRLPKAQCNDHEDAYPLPLIQYLQQVSKAGHILPAGCPWGTTTYGSKREMSGKLPSGRTEVCLSFSHVFRLRPTVQQLSK